MVTIIKNVSTKNKLITMSIILIMLVLVHPASAGVSFNYSNVSTNNYTITDSVLNSNNFIRLVDGNIEMPSVTLKFAINKTLVDGGKSLVLNSSSFGPRTTSIPNQKVYYKGSGDTAAVSYIVDASDSFAGVQVNVSTFKQVSNNVPFFSDLSVALLDFSDLKNTWNNDTKILDEFITAVNNENKINEIMVTLNSGGDYGPLSQNLVPGNYLILVTKGSDPREIITWNIIKVMPFSSSIVVGDGTGTAAPGSDFNVNISLSSSAPEESYTYITSIINRSDYADNLGKINITWDSSQTLAQATRINGIVMNDASALTDIIPRSSTTRTTASSKSAGLTLNTAALPAGSYLVHTMAFNSTNLMVAFDQRLLTLSSATTTGGGGSGSGESSGGGGVTTSEPLDNILKAESYVKNLIANTSVAYIFTAPEHGIYKIVVTGSENEDNVAVRVEVLKGVSKIVTASPPGAVYKNVNIWAGTKRIKEALIMFKVENSWLEGNGIAGDDIRILRWDGSRWVWIETKETDKDSTYTYYEAKTENLGVFAISSVKGVAVPTETAVVSTPQVTTPVSTSGAVATPPERKWIPGFEAVLAITGILAVAYMLKREK